MRNAIVSATLLLFPMASTADAGDHVVVQKDKAFSPVQLTIKSGDTITFKNDDPVNHNVFSETKGLEFSLKSQKPGESDTVTLNGVGTVEVRCAFHPAMKLVVTVEK